MIPKASGDFVVGAENLARRYRAEELIDTPLEQLVAIGERELAAGTGRVPDRRAAPGSGTRCAGDLAAPCGAIIRHAAAWWPPRSASWTRSVPS